MTIQFIPGDPNRSTECISQAHWKNHHIIAYGSGNNLILSTKTDGNKNLQTIYLEKDPVAIDINPKDGLICASSGKEIIVLKPVNEYMSVPKWTEVERIDNGSSILSIRWAQDENELAVGSEGFLSLYHIYDEYGEIKHARRWHQLQASPVEHLDITAAADKIVTYNSSSFDSFAKVWLRINYGDSNTLFDLEYLDHSPDTWLTAVKWRSLPSESEDKIEQMAHIKNLRGYIGSDDSNDVLYVTTSDNTLHVWATYDFSGHSHIKQWASISLSERVSAEYVTSIIIDNSILQSSLIPILASQEKKTEISEAFNMADVASSDLLLVWGDNGELTVSAISRINESPPNCVVLNDILTVNCSRYTIPNYSINGALETAQDEDVSSERFQVASNSIIGDHVIHDNDTVQFLVHDRVKNTVRYDELNLSNLIKSPQQAVALKNKYQGHAKSIQKLVTSTSSFEGNIMLSISNFPEHNYIWEPIILEPENQRHMSITKRFRLNVSRDHDNELEQGISNAILINDIEKPKGPFRRHLAFVIERGGHASLYDCDGVTMDDKDAELVYCQQVKDKNDDLIRKQPLALSLHKLSADKHGVIVIFDHDIIQAWIIHVAGKNISVEPADVDTLPGNYEGECHVSAVDTYLEKDISAIDGRGVFRSLSSTFDEKTKTFKWTQNNSIHTRISNSSRISGASLINKLALVDETGLELSIWDTQSGLLEYKELFPKEFGKVRDLDWTFTGSTQETSNALLSVGFSRFVLLYTQLRYDYTNKIPTFAVLKKIDVSEYSSHEIADSIWIDDGYLAIACGNQFFIDDKWVDLKENGNSNASQSINQIIRQLMIGYNAKPTSYLIEDLTRILNGPLPLYHPQFLIQALFNNEVKLVEEILVKLLQVLRDDEPVTWNLDFNFLEAIIPEKKPKIKRRLSHIEGMGNEDLGVFGSFSSVVSDLLVEQLTKVSLPLLTRHQQVTLTTVVNIVNELSQYKHSMDENGLKFFLAFKLFQSSSKQKSLSMRDISWALHSDQKEMLFADIDDKFQRRMSWENIKQTGLVYWCDTNRLTAIVENAAKNEFGDTRDPSGRVSVMYLAIKKKQVLVGLWRTVSHAERDKVLKFMSNDFSEPRWKSAASKNAFVLLGRHRYMDAAYFFLLAGLVKDCCVTLCNKIKDVELALAVARVNDDADVVKHIIENFILPDALIKGDRWMTSWVFWQLKLKEICVQALIKSPSSVVKEHQETFSEAFQKDLKNMQLGSQSHSFLRDDPLLAVLFHKLRASKSNYLEGSKAVTAEEEFNFVIKVSMIYSKMGCDYLGLLLVRNWKFLSPARTSKSNDENKKSKDLFSEFKGPSVETNVNNDSAAFQEPDMSAFSFGF